MSPSEARESLAQKIQTHRTKHHITQQKVAKQLSVPVSTVRAIENHESNDLPAVSLHGFAKQMAQAISLDTSVIAEELLALKPQAGRGESSAKSKVSSRVFVASRASLFIFVGLIVLIVASYGVWQVWQLAAAPRLSLESPSTALITNDPAVLIKGSSSPDSTVLINGDLISIDDDGNFELTVYVQPGDNVLHIQALNAFGNEAIETRRIVYEPQGGL